jgi:hypothetical protein
MPLGSSQARIRNHHHLARRGSSASADLGGSTSHAALQLDHHHRHTAGHSGQHGVAAYDVRATLGTGMEGIMQNNGSEEVFHPKGSGLSNVGYPTYQVGPSSVLPMESAVLADTARSSPGARNW